MRHFNLILGSSRQEVVKIARHLGLPQLIEIQFEDLFTQEEGVHNYYAILPEEKLSAISDSVVRNGRFGNKHILDPLNVEWFGTTDIVQYVNLYICEIPNTGMFRYLYNRYGLANSVGRYEIT